MAGRVRVLEGDLGDVPALPTDLDAVVHCAGDVSFDPPVDEGFRTNVLGTRGLLERIAEVGPQVHYVHISTAYVAGRRRGAIPEAPVDHTVDVDAETEWGMAQRRVVEHASRSADVLTKLRSKAERKHGRAGLLTAAAATESRAPRLGGARARAGRHRARAGRSAGPTATRSPRPSASACVEERARDRADDDRPPEHHRVRAPPPATRAGSRASRWPSR